MEKNATAVGRIAFLGYGACFAAGCLWGTGFYFGRLALNEMSVEHMVLYRFLFASLGMLPVALVHRRRFRLTGQRDAPAADLRLPRRARPVPAPVSRPGAHHGQPRLADGGRHAGAAGRRGRALCPQGLQEESLDRLGWLALCGFHGGRGADRPGRQPRPGSARDEPSLAGDLLVAGLARDRAGLDSAQQETDADAQSAGGDGLHHSLRDRDAGRLGPGPAGC